MIQKFVRKLQRKFGPPPNPLRKGENGHFIFIHINKTAGTSIAEAIGMPKKRHLTALETIEIVGQENWDKAYTFSIVRNPWDRVLSHYKFRVKTNQTQMGDIRISFEEWVKCTYGQPKNIFYYDNEKMFQPQVKWLQDESGNIAVDHILRFETLAEDFQKVQDKIGISSKLTHRNSTPKTKYQDFYNDECIQIVENWFMEDIEMFGYSF